MLSLYEILKVSKTGIAPDMWTALAGMNWGGADSGHEVKELTGIPPLSFTADGTSLLDYLISGNMYQTGTPSPTTPIQPNETGDKTSNLFELPTITQTINNVEYVISNGVIKATGETTATARSDAIILASDGLHRAANYASSITINTSYALPLSAGTYYFKNTSVIGTSYFVSLLVGVNGGSTSQSTARRITSGHDFTVGADEYAMIVLEVSASTTSYESKENMLNLGSTALPYEPYGYFIEIEVS